MKELLKNSSAYKVISADKANNSLSHAYLVVCQDGDMHEVYLKILAKLLMCGEDDFCGNCRVCKLIDTKSHPDVLFLPKDGKLKTDSADELVRQSVVRPFELSKKLFVVKKIEELNQYQNKLLKTLEEPPKNVHLLVSTEKPVAVLPTIKSRTKIVEIPDFTEELLKEASLRCGFYGEKLDLAIKLAGGKFGLLKRYYENDDLLYIKEVATDMIVNMTGKNLPDYSDKIKNVNMGDFISVTKLLLVKLLESFTSGSVDPLYSNLYLATEKYRYGSIIATIERLNQFEKSAYFNLNNNILTDGVLFAVIEEKNKWLKL